MKSRRSFLSLCSGSAILLGSSQSAWGQSIRRGGWLELSSLKGKAIYQRDRTRQKAWTGMRLHRVGEIFETAKGATATFKLDQGLGTIQVSEKTRFQIKALHKTLTGGRVTLLTVLQGQIRLKVRPMSNSSSRLEIFTPVGINGVRGTEFGVSVQPSGKASVATLSGRVDTTAMGQTLAIAKGLQTLTMPNESPLPPTPLQDNPNAFVTQSQVEGNTLRLVGTTDAVNTILINGEPQNTDREGNFDLSLPVDDAAFINLRVITPLGKQKDHKLPLR